MYTYFRVCCSRILVLVRYKYYVVVVLLSIYNCAFEFAFVCLKKNMANGMEKKYFTRLYFSYVRGATMLITHNISRQTSKRYEDKICHKS